MGSAILVQQGVLMKTIHPLELEGMLESVEILDIRPHLDFNKMHIEGAHSLPSSEVSAETLLCTRQLPTEPLYLVSESGALAQLQAYELERQGLDNVVVVASGMCGMAARWSPDRTTRA
jgi:rhodanese-related sulfurtransferase